MDANHMQPGVARGMHPGAAMYGEQVPGQYGNVPSSSMMGSNQSMHYPPPQSYDSSFAQQPGGVRPTGRPLEQTYSGYPLQQGRGMEMMNDHSVVPMMHPQHRVRQQQHTAPPQRQQGAQGAPKGMMMMPQMQNGMHINGRGSGPLMQDGSGNLVPNAPDYSQMGMQGMPAGGGLPGTGVPVSAGMPLNMTAMNMGVPGAQGYPSMPNMPYAMFSMGKHEPKGSIVEKRKGKWTVEEEDYVMKIIELFNRGLLSAPEGTTLRAYLADALNCDPMRITKKFTGTACLGKRVYHSAEQNSVNAEEIEKAKEELATLESRFKTRLERNRRKDQCLLEFDSSVLQGRNVVSSPAIDALVMHQGQGVQQNHRDYNHYNGMTHMMDSIALNRGGVPMVAESRDYRSGMQHPQHNPRSMYGQQQPGFGVDANSGAYQSYGGPNMQQVTPWQSKVEPMPNHMPGQHNNARGPQHRSDAPIASGAQHPRPLSIASAEMLPHGGARPEKATPTVYSSQPQPHGSQYAVHPSSTSPQEQLTYSQLNKASTRDTTWPAQGSAAVQRPQANQNSADKKNLSRTISEEAEQASPSGRRVRPRADRNDGDMFMGFLDSVRRSHSDSSTTRSRAGQGARESESVSAESESGSSKPSKKQRVTLGGSSSGVLPSSSARGSAKSEPVKLQGNGSSPNDASSDTGSSGGSDSLAQQESDATTRESGGNGSGSEDSGLNGAEDNGKGAAADRDARPEQHGGRKPQLLEKNRTEAELDSVDSDDSDSTPLREAPEKGARAAGLSSQSSSSNDSGAKREREPVS